MFTFKLFVLSSNASRFYCNIVSFFCMLCSNVIGYFGDEGCVSIPWHLMLCCTVAGQGIGNSHFLPCYIGLLIGCASAVVVWFTSRRDQPPVYHAVSYSISIVLSTVHSDYVPI